MLSDGCVFVTSIGRVVGGENVGLVFGRTPRICIVWLVVQLNLVL